MYLRKYYYTVEISHIYLQEYFCTCAAIGGAHPLRQFPRASAEQRSVGLVFLVTRYSDVGGRFSFRPPRPGEAKKVRALQP